MLEHTRACAGQSLVSHGPTKNDMNIEIDESDCIVVETKGSEVGKRGRGRWTKEEGWTKVTRQRAKGDNRASTSEPVAKAAKVFTAASEL